jgi:hypothetical protein
MVCYAAAMGLFSIASSVVSLVFNALTVWYAWGWTS